MTDVAEVARFAFEQGPGRYLDREPLVPDPEAPTTSFVLPRAVSPNRGTRLPMGTYHLLAGLRYPFDRVSPAALAPGELLGHLLVAAFGFTRREPGAAYNDHGVVPSIRSKFPVHVFVVQGRHAAYLDRYRHALLDVPSDGRQDGPAPERPTVLLAA